MATSSTPRQRFGGGRHCRPARGDIPHRAPAEWVWSVHQPRFWARGADDALGAADGNPLLMFAAAAQRLPLVTLGLLMCFNPALRMTWEILVGHEPMPPARCIGLGLIWIALAIFTADGLLCAHRGRTGILQAS